MSAPEVGVTFPAGFLAHGLHCGIRASKPDLALLVSTRPAVVAGVFTTNQFQAACVAVSREVVARGTARAVLVNSGNANAGTGAQGEAAARTSQAAVAERLDIAPEAVAVASTGVIGVPLPLEQVLAGVARLPEGLSEEGGQRFAEAIMTTDTRSKQAAATVTVGGQRIRIGGAAKGSGMIHPQMATMLAFLTTDASIGGPALQRALHEACDVTFNRISVDGDTSTNDMVLCLANGAAGAPPLDEGHPDYAGFCRALTEVCRDLAKQIARDGEGANRLLEVSVQGLATDAQAATVARGVIRSSLVKTAAFGRDANWGRVLAAAGAVGVPFSPAQSSLVIGGVLLLRDGTPQPLTAEAEERLQAHLNGETVRYELTLGSGPGQATAWGCDLTYDYVRINADYRT